MRLPHSTASPPDALLPGTSTGATGSVPELGAVAARRRGVSRLARNWRGWDGSGFAADHGDSSAEPFHIQYEEQLSPQALACPAQIIEFARSLQKLAPFCFGPVTVQGHPDPRCQP